MGWPDSGVGRGTLTLKTLSHPNILMTKMAELVQLLRTGHLYQADMVSLALKEAGVPHFLREETCSGLSLAMPISPSMGPGIWFVLLVPTDCKEDAQEIISHLPFENTLSPEVWTGGSQPNVLRLVRVIVCVILGIIALFVWMSLRGL